MNITRLIVMVLIICGLSTGCSRARLFSHTVEPFTFNREPTEMNGSTTVSGRVTQFQYPLSTGASVRIGKNGFGDIAKKNGINTIYYADLERWSVLFGLWSSEVIHIYGR